MIRRIQPAQIQKKSPSFFLVGSANSPGISWVGAVQQGRGVGLVLRRDACQSRAILGSTTVKRKSKKKLISTTATATTRVMPCTTV